MPISFKMDITQLYAKAKITRQVEKRFIVTKQAQCVT